MILTGRPDTRLSAEAHRRVHEAAAQLGYRPNLAAQALRTDKTRTIAFISDYVATTRRIAEQGLFRSDAVAQRIDGIRAAMTEHGLNFVAEESCWEWEPHHGFELTRKILVLRPDITALLCLNDRLAFGGYQALAEAGRSVAGDVSIIAFENDQIAGYLRPGLTTIALAHEQMGRRKVELLLADATVGEHLIAMPVVTRASI